MDQNVAEYRIGVRGKKWYWSIATWIIDVSIHIAWQVHRKSGGKLPQLNFRRKIAQHYLTSYGVPPKGPGRVADSVTIEGSSHYRGFPSPWQAVTFVRCAMIISW